MSSTAPSSFHPSPHTLLQTPLVSLISKKLCSTSVPLLLLQASANPVTSTLSLPIPPSPSAHSRNPPLSENSVPSFMKSFLKKRLHFADSFSLLLTDCQHRFSLTLLLIKSADFVERRPTLAHLPITHFYPDLHISPS